jgi:hypothetical protein
VTLERSTRDGEIEAFVVDRYLESLLARRPRDPSDVPAELRTTAEALAALPRYHPSFRFVEALSARLAAAALDGGEAGRVVVFPTVGRVAVSDQRTPQVRPVVIGGVLTSAAISLAGAAYVAWRRGRPQTDPMSRAVRAVARARLV